MQSWERFKEHYFTDRSLGFRLDLSQVGLSKDFSADKSVQLDAVLSEMQELEKGKIANPDEGRMVGHYWLRAPELAPEQSISDEIKQSLTSIKQFAQAIREGDLLSPSGEKYSDALIIGIGGSALGPQLASAALRKHKSDFNLHFFDNTDPDGMSLTLSKIKNLATTLCIVISKSGSTVETRNGMLVAEKFYSSHGLVFSKHAVAITGQNSNLDQYASKNGWVKSFAIWDWLGGRTSQLGPVGLLPMALEGQDIDAFLEGAREMDKLTRQPQKFNPAAQLALAWFYLGNGRGERNMVILPYRDRLECLSKYLQQLVMESIGKSLNLKGELVEQGITVFGNKGSSDQHAYVQQLRDGKNDFFVTFIDIGNDVLTTGGSIGTEEIEIEPNVYAGDYLFGFYRGTREALSQKNRPNITISFDKFGAKELGSIIALFERAVGIYALLVDINAYNQPGVEAGKKAASEVIDLHKKVIKCLKEAEKPMNVTEIASLLKEEKHIQDIFALVLRLKNNHRISSIEAEQIFDDKYFFPKDA
ncbi:MAG: glucose-6-phosphate isomerase [Bdellovibrionales bacterium]|nr:glucose-6-phosphate isomerase [Bdellovibrionales bacterium]